MKARVSASLCIAGLLAFGAIASAQGGGQPPPPGQTPPAASSAGEQVTVVGCVQREADYRQARDAGKGGVAGSGVGAGNEFVLTNVSPAGAARKDEPASPTGTAGAAMAYELTGPNEGKVAEFVGRRVEISGRLKAAETVGGKPTGGATAGTPPGGVDVTSKDLKLREFEVMSVKEATGSCPAK
jgi:hypothetical protein